MDIESIKEKLEEGDELLTLKEGAKIVRKEPRTLYRWIQKKMLTEVYRVGGRTLVLKSAVLRLMKPHPLTESGGM